MGRKLTLLSGSLLGAGVAYLLDPDRGRSRRARLADQAKAQLRDLSEAASRKARYEAQHLKGTVHEKLNPPEPPQDDATLLQKVRSEAVGPSGVRTDSLEIGVADGVVTLRGEVDGDAEELVDRVSHVAGVRRVDSELTGSKA